MMPRASGPLLDTAESSDEKVGAAETSEVESSRAGRMVAKEKNIVNEEV
jgi:hypothetical protein